MAAVPFDSPAVAALLSTWEAELLTRIPGFSPSGGSTVGPADFARPAGVFLVATRNGRPLACGGLRRLEQRVAEVKRLFVTPPARGRGLGRAVLRSLEAQAMSLGYATIRLDTHGGDHPALRLFRSAGYREIDDYNANPYARYWFEKQLT